MGLRQGQRRKRGGSMVNVQCLNGPLLWVTESEMFKKAERIRLKDFSERDDMSSDVIPFVSIFGRIFNLMIPADAEKLHHQRSRGTSSIFFLHTDTDVMHDEDRTAYD